VHVSAKTTDLLQWRRHFLFKWWAVGRAQCNRRRRSRRQDPQLL